MIVRSVIESITLLTIVISMKGILIIPLLSSQWAQGEDGEFAHTSRAGRVRDSTGHDRGGECIEKNLWGSAKRVWYQSLAGLASHKK